MADEGLHRRVGVTEYPLQATEIPENAFADKAQEVLLGLFQAAIASELGGIFDIATMGTPLAGKPIVADVWPGLLTPAVMKQRKGGFPLLAVGWTGQAEWAEHTLGIDKVTRKWAVDYVLGPLDVGPAQKLDKLLHKIAVLMQLTLRNRGHKSFRNGAVLWGSDTDEPISSIWLDQHEAGQAAFSTDAGEPTYFALSARLTTVEIDSDIATYEDLTGATFTASQGDTGNPIDIVADTEHTPTP